MLHHKILEIWFVPGFPNPYLYGESIKIPVFRRAIGLLQPLFGMHQAGVVSLDANGTQFECPENIVTVFMTGTHPQNPHQLA